MAKAKKTYQRQDVYQKVTDQIIEQMEKAQSGGGRLWSHQADVTQNPINATTGKHYNGINTVLLWFAQQEHTTNGWLTFKQGQTLGGKVRKGEKGRTIVIYKPWEREQENAQGEKESIVIPMIKQATVFNVDQFEGLDAEKLKLKVIDRCEDPILLANEVAAANNARIMHGGSKACFIPSHNLIKMPYLESFLGDSDEEIQANYSSVLLHELTHWTGHESRLNRLKNDRFGSKGYAFEELIAEIGAAMLCASLGIPSQMRHHVKYLQSWIKVLKDDKKAIFTAAAASQKACDLLLDAYEVEQQKAA